MKRILYILISLMIFTNPILAKELQGGVSFDVNSARDYLNDGLVANIDVSGPLRFEDDNTAQKVVYKEITVVKSSE